MPYHPLNRSMGNMFRRNAANSRRSAQAATFTTNQNGSTTAGPQAMQSNVFQPNSGGLSVGSVMDYLNGLPQQNPGSAGMGYPRYDVQNSGATPQSNVFQPQQGNQYAPPSVDPRDLMPSPARVRQRQAAEQRQTQADQLAGMQGLNAELRRLAEMRGRGETINQGPASLGPDAIRQLEEQDRLQSQQIAATQGGSPEYNISRGRGTPEQEAAFQASLAQQRGRQASQDFAASMPGGEQMNRFAQLQALQSNVAQPQSDDTQANLQAMREKGYGDIIMRTRDNRLALTSRGNKARGVRQQETGDYPGQMEHKGQMISGATAPEYMDAAAANRQRINDRRAARGGMSERQARDISRRIDRPSALADYAIRNGLENHPMVQSILGGGQGAAVYEDAVESGTSTSTSTPVSAAKGRASAQKRFHDNENVNAFGVEPGGDWRGYSQRFTELFEGGQTLNDKELSDLFAQMKDEAKDPKFFGTSLADSTEARTGHDILKTVLDVEDTKEARREWFNKYKSMASEQFSRDPEAGWLDPLWEMYGVDVD